MPILHLEVVKLSRQRARVLSRVVFVLVATGSPSFLAVGTIPTFEIVFGHETLCCSRRSKVTHAEQVCIVSIPLDDINRFGE